MSVSRRHFLLIGLGALAAGCSNSAKFGERPGPDWPDPLSPPRPNTGGYALRPYAQTPTATPMTTVPGPPVLTPVPPVTTSGGLQAIPRSSWAKAGPIMKSLNPMGGVDRITVHHEGWKVVGFSDYATSAQAIEKDRRGHVEDRHWGDIGYHYIIDRGGRLWEGRSVRYQGAHVESQNEHNIGVMCLGNFETQLPSDAQLTTLRDTLTKLRRQYDVNPRRIYGHRDIGQSVCPGRNLYPRVAWLRSSGALA